MRDHFRERSLRVVQEDFLDRLDFALGTVEDHRTVSIHLDITIGRRSLGATNLSERL